MLSKSSIFLKLLGTFYKNNGTPGVLNSLDKAYSSVVLSRYKNTVISCAASWSKSEMQNLWNAAQRLKDPDHDKQILLETLEQVRWNRTKAAEMLGLSRMTIWKKMKKYDLL